jgi:hypothetical protein
MMFIASSRDYVDVKEEIFIEWVILAFFAGLSLLYVVLTFQSMCKSRNVIGTEKQFDFQLPTSIVLVDADVQKK